MDKGPLGWLDDRLKKTIIPSYQLLWSSKARNPLAYLGMLSLSCFIVLGLSGISLMLYYTPDFTNSYDSVAKIMGQVPFGLDLRNIHYYASDLMILLALAHFFYLYFVGKYRYHNEVIWLTGVAFGVLTILEAYTGYILVMNTRAMMAVDIGSGLLNSISPSLSTLLTGASYSDLLLRVYTIHVIAIPAIMVLLVLVHFPRVLTVDLSAVAAVIGAVFIAGGLSPVALGVQYVPNSQTLLTVPEWYLSGIYAFLRTGAPAFVVGVFLPFVLLFAFSLLPFYDSGATNDSKWRPYVVCFGAAVIAQTVLITIWGGGGSTPLSSLSVESDLAIDPWAFWLTFAVVGALAAAIARLLLRRLERKPRTRKIEGTPIHISTLLIWPVVALQSILLFLAFAPPIRTPAGPQLVEIGLVILLFGSSVRIFTSGRPAPTKVPSS
jgi:ubiquinol-cytochrome c reductase cytochrome b subunit